MRRLILLPVCALSLLFALGLAPFAGGVRPVAAGERVCFDDTTGFCAENAFLAYWRSHGATEILGLPISQAFIDDRGLIVQFYERAILEWHPENADPQYQVLLTLLGSDRLGNRPERSAPANLCALDCAAFEATGHTLRGTFLKYWTENGGLPVFGLPLTEEFQEISPTNGQPYIVQYFERNRFELHPEAPARYQVLLGLLGFESLKGQRQVLGRPATTVPDFKAPPVAPPARLAIPAIGVDAAIEQVGLDATGNMDTPSNPHNTAWYAPGPRPGQPGNAVIAGHVDYRGLGPVVFWNLRQLTPGAEIVVTTADGSRRRFVVTAVETYLTDQAPLNRIFGLTGDANLNLISCIGDFEPASASYNKRIVVYSRWDGIVR